MPNSLPLRARDYKDLCIPCCPASSLLLFSISAPPPTRGASCVQVHRAGQTPLLLFGLLALVAHAFSLYQQLLTPAGLVLDFNAASLIAAAR